jgi:hypothetical protein
MIRSPFVVVSICAGLACLVMVSCREPVAIKSMFRSKTLTEESHFGFFPKRVSLLVESDDKKLESELKACLFSRLGNISGVTIVNSEPLYIIEALALPMQKEIAVSAVVYVSSSPCSNRLVAHHALVGERADLERLCQEVVSSFEKELVAPYR